jgi:hypothetical protein
LPKNGTDFDCVFDATLIWRNHETHHGHHQALQIRRSSRKTQRLEVDGMTVSEAKGYGRQKGRSEIYRGALNMS